MGKTLSVVIPTLNRYEYLKRTLALMLPQVERNQDKVELVICNNASKDETDDYMKSIVAVYPFVQYHYFDEYVEVGDSLIRSVGQSNGEYVVLWGDDDIPYPYFVDTVLDIIHKYPEVGIIHCNRLSGKDAKYDMRKVKVHDSDYYEKDVILDLEELVQKFTISLGFISSLIFRRDCWEAGICNYSKEHYGYEHLAMIVTGAKGLKCSYYSLPIEIQRNPLERDFTVKWPLYRFIGVPNMMKDFDRLGVTTSAFKNWETTWNGSFIHFLWNMMFTSLDKKMYKPLCKELNKYQNSAIRRCFTYLIIWGMPKGLFKILRNKLY
ncbi:MAG: glycosyltransferase family A protein [Prevotella sp.]|nr:glycosyltransferase family A protein [Prevotella sp.]